MYKERLMIIWQHADDHMPSCWSSYKEGVIIIRQHADEYLIICWSSYKERLMRRNEQKCPLGSYYASCAIQSCHRWALSWPLDEICTSLFKRTQKGILEDAKAPVHFLKYCVLKVTTCPRPAKNVNTSTNVLLSVVWLRWAGSWLLVVEKMIAQAFRVRATSTNYEV